MKIDDVAKKLKVSVATISRALNPRTSHLVADKTRKRVLRFVEKIGYVPDRSARELSTGKTYTIGLVLPNILESIFFNDYLVKVLTGVYGVLEKDRRYNCKIVILPKGEVLTHIDQHVIASGIDGLLLSPYCDPALYTSQFPKDFLSKWNKPVVMLNLDTRSLKRFNCVYSDHHEAARKAVTYLIQKGHRHIAMIKGSDVFPESEIRFQGYKKALAEHGLSFKPSFLAHGNLLIDSGYDATLHLIQSNKSRRPTAIFCGNDEMAIGALRALQTLRIPCPRDVAIMGYDGLDLGEYVQPRLSSVTQPTLQIAESATSLLLDLIENEAKGPVSKIIPSPLLLRDSA